MNYQKIVVAGRLARNPELKALPSGQNVTNFSVAVGETYTDRDGNKQEKTEFINVVVFGKQADNCAKYLAKGQIVIVEGKLATRSYDKDGQKHYRTEVVAQSVQFGPKAGGSREEVDEVLPEDEINPDDIPF